MKTFKEVVDYRERNNVKRNDAMQLLIDLKNKGYVDDVDNPNKGDDSDKSKKRKTLWPSYDACI